MMQHIKRFLTFFPVIGVIGVFIAIIIYNLVNVQSSEIVIDVEQKIETGNTLKRTYTLPVINHYPQSIVKGKPAIDLTNNGLLIKLMAPHSELIMDNLYALAIIISCSVIVIKFWHFNKEKLFKIKISETFESIGILLQALWVINLLRCYWFNYKVKILSENDYFYHVYFFAKPEFWISIVLLRLAWVMKKGEELQQEQDLTI